LGYHHHFVRYPRVKRNCFSLVFWLYWPATEAAFVFPICGVVVAFCLIILQTVYISMA
jgi:hypothetical protein